MRAPRPDSKSRHLAGVATAEDPVARQFHCDQAGELWVTKVTEHPTGDGKVYCAIVLDAWSRRVIGWSIDGSPTTALVTSALGMAIDQRQPTQAQLFTATRAQPGSE
jgi:putative transposase